MDIGVRELRDHLSRHLAEVRGGHILTITDHGQPVARIVPIDTLSPLELLRKQGRVQQATQRKGLAPKPVAARGTVSDLLDEQRR